MTKYSVDSGREPSREDARHVAPTAPTRPPAQREAGVGCDSYEPGHQMHYKHQGDAVRSPSVVVRSALLDGTAVTLLLTEQELEWRHHDPDRLRRILELLRGRCVAYPDQHALRVGPYWFNCATPADAWQECQLSRAAASS